MFPDLESNLQTFDVQANAPPEPLPGLFTLFYKNSFLFLALSITEQYFLCFQNSVMAH